MSGSLKQIRWSCCSASYVCTFMCCLDLDLAGCKYELEQLEPVFLADIDVL